MTFLDESRWTGQVNIGGWVAGGGGTSPVVEPATGRELGTIGMASTDDVLTAATAAAALHRGVRCATLIVINTEQMVSKWLSRAGGHTVVEQAVVRWSNRTTSAERTVRRRAHPRVEWS